MTLEEPGAGATAQQAVDPSAPGYLGVDVSWNPAGTVVCRLAGDLDLGSLAPVRTALERALASHSPLLVVDLAGVEFCDSSGLNLLLQVRMDAEAAGVVMRLASLTPAVSRVFELTGAVGVFSIHASAEEAEHV
jgi:anti-anti-sigma factor